MFVALPAETGEASSLPTSTGESGAETVPTGEEEEIPEAEAAAAATAAEE